MCITLSDSMLHGDGTTHYYFTPTKNFSLLMTKFACSGILHLILFPSFQRSMVLMKYVNNHPDEFSHPKIVFLVTLINHIIIFTVEIINIFYLGFQDTIVNTLIYVVELGVVVITIPKVYNSSLIDDNLKEHIFATQ